MRGYSLYREEDQLGMVTIGWHHYRACLAGAWNDLIPGMWIGAPFQHTDPYLLEAHRRGFKVARTIGAMERPTEKDFSVPIDGIFWDLEGGGDPTENARWFRILYNRTQAKLPSCNGAGIYSGLPGCLYAGQTIQARYGCDYALLHREFRRWWGWPRPLPVACVGGIRGVLPGHALDGMPAACPALHSIATPPDWSAPGVEQELREQVRDRLAWVRKWTAGGGIMLVKSKDGPAGSRWLPEDSLLCRWLGEEIRNA